jgi:DNA-binding NarL/FixJ family response regulator
VTPISTTGTGLWSPCSGRTVFAAHQAMLRRRGPGPKLTDRQWQLLRLLGEGLTNRQIAHALAISEHTVRKHLEQTFARLEVTSRTAAVSWPYPAPAAWMS